MTSHHPLRVYICEYNDVFPTNGIVAAMSDSKVYKCQNEPKYDKEELLSTSAENYSDFERISKINSEKQKQTID